MVLDYRKTRLVEFSWRGYLTPRFEAIGLHSFANVLLTGWVWAGWHVPYYLYFLDRAELQAHTSLSLSAFILLAFLVLPFPALAYGELRLLRKTVWTTYLLHNVADAISLPLLAYDFVVLPRNLIGDILSLGTAGIVYSFLMGLVGLGLDAYRRRKLLHAQEQIAAGGTISGLNIPTPTGPRFNAASSIHRPRKW